MIDASHIKVHPHATGQLVAIRTWARTNQRLEACATNVDRFIESARRYTQITELAPEILRMFISKIVIHEKSEKYSRTAEQKVEIHYAHIGAMETMDNPSKTEMERTA